MNAKGLPSGDAAYAMFPEPDLTRQATSYEIGPLDVLSITVFQEPDLSFSGTGNQLQVDAAGNISYPLLGTVRAAGKTALELSNEIAAALGRKYLVDPQVSVTVAASISQRVTVEGDVNKPGTYEINGTSTLLEALAQAESPTEVAKLDQIVIFRRVDGKRMGGVFNLNDIREGKAADPEIKGGDVIVVGFSAVKGAFRDLFKAAPFFNVFRYF
ncbi:polysaccharide biosynthesis/export family protein [Stakelama marina]|nr:polysaccharide biosynthesis/export family protein [Stakelama marina]